MPLYTLLDGVMWNAKYPKTFSIPPNRGSLLIGDYAALTFMWGGNEKDRERMWVRVTDVIKHLGKVSYIGEMANDSVGGELVLGDKVEFQPKNVLSIIRRES